VQSTRQTEAKKIGQRIRNCREKAGLTMSQLAVDLDLTSQMVYKYEHGLSQVPSDRLAAIAKLLGVQTSDLLPAEPLAEKPLPQLVELSEDERSLMWAYRQLQSKKVQRNLVKLIESMATSQQS